MEAFIIIKVKIFFDVLNSLPNGFIVVKIGSFIFHGTPEALYLALFLKVYRVVLLKDAFAIDLFDCLLQRPVHPARW